MRHAAPLASTVLVLVLGSAAIHAQARQETRPPSDVLHDIAQARLLNPRWAPNQIDSALQPVLVRADTSELLPAEEVALGLAYFFSFDGLRARARLEKQLARDDLLGRVAWQAMQQMAFFGASDYALVERRLGEFRKKFAVTPDDPEYTSRMVSNLTGYYASLGEHRRVVDLILEDVQALPIGVPLRSFELLGMRFASFQATGQAQLALDWMKRHRDALASDRTGPPEAAGSSPVPPDKVLGLPHRAGVLHLYPFNDLLYPDDPNWSREKGERFQRSRARDQFTRWIAALEKGEPLPARPDGR